MLYLHIAMSQGPRWSQEVHGVAFDFPRDRHCLGTVPHHVASCEACGRLATTEAGNILEPRGALESPSDAYKAPASPSTLPWQLKIRLHSACVEFPVVHRR